MEENAGKNVKSTIAKNLYKRVIDENALAREPASQDAIVPLCRRIKHVTQFGKNVKEIAIHHQNVLARCFMQAIPHCIADAVRRTSVNWMHPRLDGRKSFKYFPSLIRAIVID